MSNKLTILDRSLIKTKGGKYIYIELLKLWSSTSSGSDESASYLVYSTYALDIRTLISQLKDKRRFAVWRSYEEYSNANVAACYFQKEIRKFTTKSDYWVVTDEGILAEGWTELTSAITKGFSNSSKGKLKNSSVVLKKDPTKVQQEVVKIEKPKYDHKRAIRI